uniref:Ras-related protein Rab n=1 Tax=Gouania willdenowi TaxID=441366 RepID=A0A8C5DND4_GOUWI
MQQQQERLLKVLVIGDLGVGKTSIIKRYVHQVFSQHYRATIGVDFALKVLSWDQQTVVRLQLWDIAGQERYGNMTRVYYREAVGALVVFDMTRLSTFQAVLKWKGDLDSKVALGNGRPVPAVLLANKCDQRSLGLCPKVPKLESFSQQYGFVGWYETSAKGFGWWSHTHILLLLLLRWRKRGDSVLCGCWRLIVERLFEVFLHSSFRRSMCFK